MMMVVVATRAHVCVSHHLPVIMDGCWVSSGSGSGISSGGGGDDDDDVVGLAEAVAVVVTTVYKLLLLLLLLLLYCI